MIDGHNDVRNALYVDDALGGGGDDSQLHGDGARLYAGGGDGGGHGHADGGGGDGALQ